MRIGRDHEKLSERTRHFTLEALAGGPVPAMVAQAVAEVEIAFDEMKTRQNANAHGQLQTAFRSKTPRNVMREAYARLVAYNLIRRTRVDAAEALLALWRRPRRSPRVARVKMSEFLLKRPRHRQEIADFAQLVRKAAA